MISDILFDAALEIKRYQKTCPEAYSAITPAINNCLSVMDGLRQYLDAPPHKHNPDDLDCLCPRCFADSHSSDPE